MKKLNIYFQFCKIQSSFQLETKNHKALDLVEAIVWYFISKTFYFVVGEKTKILQMLPKKSAVKNTASFS